MQNLIPYPTSFGALSGLWALYICFCFQELVYDPKRLQYVIPWARLGNPRANAQAPATGEKLWEWMEEQIYPTLTAKES